MSRCLCVSVYEPIYVQYAYIHNVQYFFAYMYQYNYKSAFSMYIYSVCIQRFNSVSVLGCSSTS